MRKIPNIFGNANDTSRVASSDLFRLPNVATFSH